jgi:hypothetical protein
MTFESTTMTDEHRRVLAGMMDSFGGGYFGRDMVIAAVPLSSQYPPTLWLELYDAAEGEWNLVSRRIRMRASTFSTSSKIPFSSG